MQFTGGSHDLEMNAAEKRHWEDIVTGVIIWTSKLISCGGIVLQIAFLPLGENTSL